MTDTKITLPESEIPTHFYNIAADLPTPLPRISYAEAALIAGVSLQTILSWVYRRRNPLPRCAARGPYRIDALDLDKFLRKGLK